MRKTTNNGATRAAASPGARRSSRDASPAPLKTALSKVGHAVDSNPGRTIAIALGAGYIVGGGLFSPLTARLFGIAVRVALRAVSLPLVTNGIVALGSNIIEHGDSAKRVSA